MSLACDLNKNSKTAAEKKSSNLSVFVFSNDHYEVRNTFLSANRTKHEINSITYSTPHVINGISTLNLSFYKVEL